MHITFRQMRLFLALADTGSVSAAARALHVTQPTASMQLREITESVGLPLYDVIGRKVFLTDAGRQLAQTARAIAGELVTLRRAIHAEPELGLHTPKTRDKVRGALGDLPLDADSVELLLGIEASDLEVVANGGSNPTPAMLAWARELQPGAWFTLDHNGRVARVQFVWRSERKQLNLFASAEGRSYLIQAGRLAAYLQAGLLLPQEEEPLTVRATRDALTKLEANPERLLG